MRNMICAVKFIVIFGVFVFHPTHLSALSNVLKIIDLCTAFAKSQKADAAAFLATVK